jgi:hypothetical protein
VNQRFLLPPQDELNHYPFSASSAVGHPFVLPFLTLVVVVTFWLKNQQLIECFVRLPLLATEGDPQ